MKNKQSGSIIPILIIIVVVMVAGVGYVLTKSTKPVSDLKEYSIDGITLQYPSVLAMKQVKGSAVFSHSIPYVHPNPCDFKGDAPPLENLTDFNASFQVIDADAESYVKEAGWPDWDYVSKNPYSFGTLSGYKVSSGIEGCGADLYYLSIAPQRTLVITRPYAAEFNSINADYQKYLNLPDVINPEKAEGYFSNMLSSLKIK